MTTSHKMTFAGLAAVAVALSLAVAPAFTNQAFAKITEEDVACENPSGKRPPGQQPECQNENLDQITENQNPAGKAPPGHNK